MFYNICLWAYSQILNQAAKGQTLALLAAASGTQKKGLFL
jgi:hypothetical protein